MSGIGDSDKAKTTQSKKADEAVGEKVELQNLSVKKPSEGGVSTEKMANETLLESTNTKVEIKNKIEAETAKLLVDIQDKNVDEIVDDVQEAGKNMRVSSSNENKNKNDVPEILSTDSVTETEREGNELAKQSEIQVDAIKDTDVTNEADVIKEVQSDISNEVQSNVTCEPAIDTKPSQISVTFQIDNDGNPIEAGNETEGGCTVNDMVNFSKQSVTIETCTSPTNDDVIDDSATCQTNDESKENESSAASESVKDCNVANEIQGQHSRVADEVEDNDEDDVSLNDMVLCQPLVPQVSEAVRVGVIALVPEDNDTCVVTEENNNEVVSEENQEE